MCVGLIIIKIALTLWSVVRSVNIMMPSNPRKDHGVREGMNAFVVLNNIPSLLFHMEISFVENVATFWVS